MCRGEGAGARHSDTRVRQILENGGVGAAGHVVYLIIKYNYIYVYNL